MPTTETEPKAKRWRAVTRADAARVGGASLAFGGVVAGTLGSPWLLAPFVAVALGASARWLALTLLEQPPTAADWHALEERFGLVQVEIEGILVTDCDSGEPRWTIYPQSPPATRDGMQPPVDGEGARQRFTAEATRGGRLLLRMVHGRPMYRIGKEFEEIDHWLSAISIVVPSGSSFKGSGSEMGRPFKSVHFERLVHASKDLCASLAALAD